MEKVILTEIASMKDFLIILFIGFMGVLSYMLVYLPAYFFYKHKLADKVNANSNFYFATIPCILYLLLCIYKDRQGFNYLFACASTALAPSLFLTLTSYSTSLNSFHYFKWALAFSCVIVILIWLFFPSKGFDRLI